jgi:hypothetical protein
MDSRPKPRRIVITAKIIPFVSVPMQCPLFAHLSLSLKLLFGWLAGWLAGIGGGTAAMCAVRVFAWPMMFSMISWNKIVTHLHQ